MLNELENNPDLLDIVVTGNESWTFQYDPETKAQSSEWHTPASPRPKKARMSKSRVKTMLIVFFDKRGLSHKEFVPQGKTVNAEFYKEVLRRLHKAVKRKRQDLEQRWRLHHDNASAHTAFLPPYSPDMSPSDLFLFPKVKRCLKGHRFDDIPNIQPAVTKALTGITPTDYSGAYETWKTRWQRCVDAQGEGSVEGWSKSLVFNCYDPGSIPTLGTFFLIEKNAPMAPDSCKIPTHQRVQVTKRGSGTFIQVLLLVVAAVMAGRRRWTVCNPILLRLLLLLGLWLLFFLICVAGGVRIKGHYADPGLVTLSACHHPPLMQGPHCNQVILPSHHHVLAVWAPADTSQLPKVASHHAHHVHGVIVEDPEEAILTHSGQVLGTRGEGKLIERSLPNRPHVERVAGTLGLTDVDGEALALLEELPADLSKPVEKKSYKGTFPTCHDFNKATVGQDTCPLLVGFSAGQIQLIDPNKKEISKLYNEEVGSLSNLYGCGMETPISNLDNGLIARAVCVGQRLIDKTMVTCLRWLPNSPNLFLVSHSSGHMYVYKEGLPCSATTPQYQLFKQGEGFSVYICKTKSTRNPLYMWSVGEGSLNEFAFSPCSKYLATVSQDGFLRVFNYDTMDVVGMVRSYFGELRCVCWSPDCKYVVVGGEDDLVTVWSLHQRRVVARGQGHKSWISVVAFDPYATCYADQEEQQPQQQQQPQQNGVADSPPPSSCHHSSNNQQENLPTLRIISYRFGSLGQDTQLCFWDLTEDILKQPAGRTRASTYLASPNNKPSPPPTPEKNSQPPLPPPPVTEKKEHRRNFSLSSRTSNKNSLNKASSVQQRSEDPVKLIGTSMCPRLDEVPMLEPLVCKKIAHERLTDLVFREDCFMTACQEGYISTWARPGRDTGPDYFLTYAVMGLSGFRHQWVTQKDEAGWMSSEKEAMPKTLTRYRRV
ncbi:WDR20 [Cordylochernes scorpioides]|uniref:WDR20 n=1 Tax=Cordylochernes scorpioides TaxID=51811 RepID=A0ABY6LP91_9ARAC|nr:WDR20 [Cordylochernes scorpioides]